MGESATCSECGNELAAGATATICPRCVFARVQLDSGIFGRGGGDSKTEFDPLTVDELTEMLPNFEIIKMIGRGGMGLVYQARQTNLDRLVAIKLLPVEAAIDPEFEDRFMREARTMVKLQVRTRMAYRPTFKVYYWHLPIIVAFVILMWKKGTKRRSKTSWIIVIVILARENMI